MSGEWYAATRDYTRRLAQVRGVSPSADENRVTELALRLLREGGLDDAYTLSGLDPIEGDPHGRHNAYAFLRGQSSRAVVLLGHVDTVGADDYGALEPWAFDPDALAARRELLEGLGPDVAADLAAGPDDWMFGRGVADMKSGVAATIAVMRRLAEKARAGSPPPLSVVLLATVDEENESAGVLQAVRFLHALRERHGLAYAGVVNTDYTAARYPGDPHRYIYVGTVGKLLPSIFVVGQAAHAGDPFAGLDANLLAAELVRDLSMNTDLCDAVRGEVAPPPVTLHAADLKTGYDTQLPFAAAFYLNVVTLTTSPATLLARLRGRAETVLAGLLARLNVAAEDWLRATAPTPRRSLPGVGEGETSSNTPEIHPNHNVNVQDRGRARSGTVLTYAELRAETAARLGEDLVADALSAEWDRWPLDEDKRERCLRLVRRLWALSGRQGPAVVLYYAPPYYPHVAALPASGVPDALSKAVAAVAAAHPELNLVVREYFPLLSDLSYLRLDPALDLAALRDNMPVWREASACAPPRAGSYSLPIEAMRALDLPVVNVGPYGRAVHQAGERVLMPYSFGVVPQLIYETIERLARL
jgi:arginine utilization protein RocB